MKISKILRTSQDRLDEKDYIIDEVMDILLNLRETTANDGDGELNCDFCPAMMDVCPCFGGVEDKSMPASEFGLTKFCKHYLIKTLLGIRDGTIKEISRER